MGNKIKRSNFVIIQGWMITDLKLKGNQLMIFAVIYGFSQDGESEFTGSISYLREWLGGASKNTITKALNELISQGFIVKRQEDINGVKFNRYRVDLEAINNYSAGSEIDQSPNCTPGSKIDGGGSKIDLGGRSEIDPPPGQKLTGGRSKIDPNNIYINNIYNKNNINKDISMCGASDDAPLHIAASSQQKKKPKDPKHKYGEYQHVLLTDTEIEKLKTEYGVQLANEAVTFLDEYIEMKGYSAKSHYLCIRKWVINAVHEKQERDRKAFSGRQLTRSEQEMQEFYDMTERWAESDEEGF